MRARSLPRWNSAVCVSAPPLGIYNNKPNGIYISCSLDTESAGDQTNSGIKIWFSNFVG
jgi:hypothetical protein